MLICNHIKISMIKCFRGVFCGACKCVKRVASESRRASGRSGRRIQALRGNGRVSSDMRVNANQHNRVDIIILPSRDKPKGKPLPQWI
jgi:hypothetical protein